jgi:hypothetical protein
MTKPSNGVNVRKRIICPKREKRKTKWETEEIEEFHN